MAAETLQDTQEQLVLALLEDGEDDFTSGEALSNKLGLSRAELWRYVESLRGKGYRIEAVAARGYRLLEVPDHITPLEIAPHLNTREVGRIIHYRESVSSTNELAFRLASEGAGHGEVVIAEAQSQGKGRRGRAWISPPGLNLYFSIILRPELSPQRAPELTLVAALAAAEGLSARGVGAQIKWPNDLLIGGKKVGGILTELSSDSDRIQFAVVGMGINVNSLPSHFPPLVAANATSVAEALGTPIRRAHLVVDLWARLERWMDIHLEEGFFKVRDAWRVRCSMLGKSVTVDTGSERVAGVAEDIDESGALLLRTDDGRLQRILAGDVEQLRPQPATQ